LVIASRPFCFTASWSYAWAACVIIYTKVF
jgi:hypothetical protein